MIYLTFSLRYETICKTTSIHFKGVLWKMKRKKILFILVCLLAILIVGCSSNKKQNSSAQRLPNTEILSQDEQTSETLFEAENEEETLAEQDTSSESVSVAPNIIYSYSNLDKIMYATQTVYVRDLPSLEGNKLGTLTKNQEVKVTGQCNETAWYRIEFNNATAYVSGSYISDEKQIVTGSVSQGEKIDSYGGYFEFTHSDGGIYHLGQYCFAISFYDELTDERKQIYKNYVTAGEGNITELTRNADGGRTYGILYSAYPDQSDELHESYGNKIAEYAAKQNLWIWKGVPHEDQALGWGGNLGYINDKDLYFVYRQNFYTLEEIEKLRNKYYPNGATEYHCSCGGCDGVWYNYPPNSPTGDDFYWDDEEIEWID